jgi:proline dehydrogenase
MPSNINFDNTEVTFSHKSDKALKKMAWLFKMMNQSWIVKYGSSLGVMAINWHIPFAETIVKNTIFEQFCGGTSLVNALPAMQKLSEYKTQTILDYGVEAKESEEEYDNTMLENVKAIEFAAKHSFIPIVSIKVTGLGRFGLLEHKQKNEILSDEEKTEYQRMLKRVDTICLTASKNNISIFIDAEESWIQDSIDEISDMMMARYNNVKATVYNTFQMYRHDRLDFLKISHNKAKMGGYVLGAKLVRGAYMEKERKRAVELNYPTPINPDKQSSDDLFNHGLMYCVDHIDTIALCNASHNRQSTELLIQLMEENGLAAYHHHIMFSQLYGMSDNLTFNLAANGYNSSKYTVYGKVKDVVPYLVRRAQENTSVTGDMSREYSMIAKEVKRRSNNG